jgi:hypothetical protein
VKSFLAELHTQRMDDHRYYHHSTINQSLHLISALSFVCAYALLFTDPALAALLAWLVSMTSRQSGHFFFEPKSYDHINQATHEHKEDIKIGYNLRRKWVLMGLWAAIPVVLHWDPTFFGTMRAAATGWEYVRDVGLLWLWLGLGGLVFRTVHLFFLRDVSTGLVWATKILTDPFHDIKLYWRSPLKLMKGQLIDPAYFQQRAAASGE